MLVDGGLARHALQRAAAQLAQRGATTCGGGRVRVEDGATHSCDSDDVEIPDPDSM